MRVLKGCSVCAPGQSQEHTANSKLNKQHDKVTFSAKLSSMSIQASNSNCLKRKTEKYTILPKKKKKKKQIACLKKLNMGLTYNHMMIQQLHF